MVITIWLLPEVSFQQEQDEVSPAGGLIFSTVGLHILKWRRGKLEKAKTVYEQHVNVGVRRQRFGRRLRIQEKPFCRLVRLSPASAPRQHVRVLGVSSSLMFSHPLRH